MDLLSHLTATLLIYTGLALSLNFVMGKTSIWSVGHLGFYGIGTLFAAAVLDASLSPSLAFWAGLVGAGGCGALLGYVIGLTTLRLRKDYFVILSLAFSELVFGLSLSLKGPAGFDRLARPALFGIGLRDDWTFIGLVLAPFMALLIWLFHRFSASPVERACALIRTSEEFATVLRLSPVYYKLSCISLSAAVAAMCGALSTFFFSSTDPNQISLQNNLLLFAAVIFGGLNSISGSIIGGLLLVAVPTILEALIFRNQFGSLYSAQFKQILFGILLLAAVRFLPAGVAGNVALSESAVNR
jgi:branched-chain amino acid transport system permease protein